MGDGVEFGEGAAADGGFEVELEEGGGRLFGVAGEEEGEDGFGGGEAGAVDFKG